MTDLSLRSINFLWPVSAIICTFLFTAMLRYLTQKKIKRALSEEIAQRDNFALGINYAAEIAVIIIMISNLFNDITTNVNKQTPLIALSYLLISFVFVYVGQYIHKRWILHLFNEKKAILKQNMGAAIINSSMLVANCFLVIGLLNWIEINTALDFLLVTLAYVLLQFMFAFDSKLREKRFAKCNQGASLQYNFKLANTSLGIRYATKTLALSLIFFAALKNATVVEHLLIDNLVTLFSHCVMLWGILYLLSYLLLKILMGNIDIALEVEHQDNIGIACIELAVYLGVGVLLINIASV